jgi:hypothetical protein
MTNALDLVAVALLGLAPAFSSLSGVAISLYRACRRGDRIMMLFAAVHESVSDGTSRHFAAMQ